VAFCLHHADERLCDSIPPNFNTALSPLNFVVDTNSMQRISPGGGNHDALTAITQVPHEMLCDPASTDREQ
jgi:hypothetical protein